MSSGNSETALPAYAREGRRAGPRSGQHPSISLAAISNKSSHWIAQTTALPRNRQSDWLTVRRTSHCWPCGGGRDADQIGESTPCTWTCTGRNVAERKHGAGSRASRRRCRTVDAGCMGDLRQERQRAIGMQSSTAAIRQRLMRDAGRFRRLSEQAGR